MVIHSYSWLLSSYLPYGVRANVLTCKLVTEMCQRFNVLTCKRVKLCDNMKKLCTSGSMGFLAKKEVHVCIIWELIFIKSILFQLLWIKTFKRQIV